VQCTSWSTQSTTGMMEVEYYLSSRWVEDAAAQSHYSEELFLLDELPTFQERISQPESVTREHLGLPADKHLYVCPQTVLKFHPEQDALFRQILERDPQGMLVIKGSKNTASSQLVHNRLRQSLGKHAAQLITLPWLSLRDYYGLIALADVVLDPINFSAGSSAYDMFSFGTPVVTMPGQFYVSRYTAACYKRMGLDQYITNSPENYITQAVQWGTNPDLRQHVKQHIQDRSDVLFRNHAAVAAFEQFFEMAVSRLR
jgi:protein O-GlcNAc transferase